MRIWLIHQQAIPATKMGPTRHYDLAKKMIEKGHEVYIFAGNYCHNNFEFISPSYHASKNLQYYDTVPFVWYSVPAYTKNSFKRVWNMWVFAYQLLTKKIKKIPRPDVIIGSSPSPFAAYAACRLANRYRVPFLYEIRDLWPETLLNLGKMSPSHPFVYMLKRIEKTLVQKANKIISVLPGTKDYFAKEKLAHAEIIWLPNAVDFSRFKNKADYSNEAMNIVYTGAFNLSNDLETLLLAAKILQKDTQRTYSIKLYGEGPEKKALQDMIKRENISIVQILPTVPKKEITEILSGADVCVALVKKTNLYQYGTSLNKVTDYLAMGKPVIFALDSPYNPIKEANAGYVVEPENPIALADAIARMGALSLEERQVLGLNAKRYAKQHYDIDKMADHLIQHLQSLV